MIDYGSYFRLTHTASVAAPSLAEYSKGSSTLCGVIPCGVDTLTVRVAVSMPGAVSLRPALAAGTNAQSATSFRLTTGAELFIRGLALRRVLPVFTIERV